MEKAVKPRKVLFVCTGNIFRSLTAKYCLMNYLKKNGITDVVVDSAGTVAKKQAIDPVLFKTLKLLGMDPSLHKQKKLTKRDLLDNDIIIAMSQDHINFIESKFSFNDAVLFNSVATDEDTSVYDVDPAHDERDPVAHVRFVTKTVMHIKGATPALYNNLDKYLLFSDLINGRRPHMEGLPFIPLYETKNTVAFMSISIPTKEDGHILVIPKRRYAHLDNVPKKLLGELIETVTIVGKALKKTHGGYNVLVNIGRDAGQYVYHTHFHVIPRNHKDDIRIEVWKSKKLTPEEFLSLNDRIKDALIQS